MSNEIESIIEDIEEKDLVENQELEAEETVEEVSEEIEVAEESQPLSDTVLNVLLGEKKTNEKADEVEEEDEVEEDEEEVKEGKHEKEEDAHGDEKEEDAHEDEKNEAAHDDEKEEDAHEDEKDESVTDDEEEAMKANSKSTDDSVKKIGKQDVMPEVTTKAGYLAASFAKLKEMRKSALVSAYGALNPVSEEEGEEVKEMPKTKADLINAMYGQLKNMKKDDIMASYKSIMSSYHDDVKEEVEADHFAQDLKVLAEADQNLTDDFKQKASILFEGAVANKTAEIKESLEAQYAEDLEEEVGYVRDSLVEKIDSYLGYVVESWIEENQEFVDNKLRTEIAEGFMKALQNTFTEHYIEVPDSKVDLVDELAEQVTEAKQTLDEVTSQKQELARQVEELTRQKIVSEATADLAATQAGKLAKLLEEVDFVDADTFSEKVATIKEDFFKESTSTEAEESETEDATEVKTIIEGASEEPKHSPDMERYVSQLSRFK